MHLSFYMHGSCATMARDDTSDIVCKKCGSLTSCFLLQMGAGKPCPPQDLRAPVCTEGKAEEAGPGWSLAHLHLHESEPSLVSLHLFPTMSWVRLAEGFIG